MSSIFDNFENTILFAEISNGWKFVQAFLIRLVERKTCCLFRRSQDFRWATWKSRKCTCDEDMTSSDDNYIFGEEEETEWRFSYSELLSQEQA